jgi:ubiquinone/menaquinone biosynthesis C-methylase UbiE
VKSTVYFRNLHPKTRSNLDRYEITAWLYDILDCPWERQYRKWRPSLVGDLGGRVLEAGVGTGRNLKYYHTDVELTAIDLSSAMLKRARRRARHARCRVDFVLEDACSMASIPSGSHDWVIATYLCCVIPEELQRSVLEQFARVLKPGGRFRLLEMIYSKTPKIRKRQDFFAPFVEKVYGARFDRRTLAHLAEMGQLKVTRTTFLKHDVYLLIEGVKEDEKL